MKPFSGHSGACMRKPVWLFSEGSLKRKDLLGNKGANLCEMTSLGMPVPFGFIITTQTHLEYQRLRQRIPEGTMEEVKAALLKDGNQSGGRIRQSGQSFARFGSFLSFGFHARDDGYPAQPRHQR